MAQYDGRILIDTEIRTRQAKIQLASLENRIVKTADEIASLRSKMDSLKDTKIPTREYAELEKEAERLAGRLGTLTERQEKFLSTGGSKESTTYKRMDYDVENLKASLNEAISEMERLKASGKAFTLGQNTEEYAKLGQELQYAKNNLSVLNQQHEVLELKLKKAKNGYKEIGNTAKKSFDKINKSAKKTNGLLSQTGLGFKNILKYGLGIRSLYALFGKIRSAIKEGFGNLYNESERFKKSVDGLKASSTTLKNSFAAAFAPIVEIAIPYLQRLMDYISKLLGMFGQFTALITGQKSYTKAIKQTASATKEAAKAAKGYLNPLDEINKYSTQDIGGADVGAGGPMFEEVPVNQKLLDFFDKIAAYAKKLKDIFNQGFWDGLGDWEYRWESIKDSVKSIKDSLIDIWTDPAVLASADKWVQSVAYMLGSLVGSLASIGLTLGANLLGGLAKYLEQNKDRIKKYLISIFDIWTDVNYLLSSLFQSIAYVFEAFASENGQQLTANIIGIFSDAFMGVTEIASKLIRDILNIFIKPFVENKEAFRNALEGFLGVLAIVTGTIKDAIDDTFDKLNEVYDKHFKPFFDSIAQGLSDLVGKFMEFWNGKVQPILDQMASDFDALWKTHMQPFINNAIDLIGKVVDVLKVLWENVLQPFISWFIQNILPVILPAIQAIWDLVVDFVAFIADVAANIIKVLGGIIDFLLGVFTGDWERAFGGIRDIVDGVLGVISNIIEAFLNTIKNAVNIALTAIKVIIESIISVIKGIIESSIKHVGNTVLGGIDGMKKSFDKFKEDLHRVWNNTWSSLGDAVKSIIESVKNTVQAFFDWITEKVNSIIDKISSVGRKSSSITSGAGSKFLSGSFSSSNKYLRSASYMSIPDVPIPKLATGAVIPANREFLAVLGDQKHGTNIEAPLDTIVDAFKIALQGNIGGGSSNTYRVTAQANRSALFDIIIEEGKLRQMSTGKDPFVLT